jgi:methionine-rich copper-binding protein CopC
VTRFLNARYARKRLPLAVSTSAALLLLVLSAPTASAHSELEGASPAEGAVLQSAPDAVTLTFNEPIQLDGSGIVVRDAQGNRYDKPDSFSVKENLAGIDLSLAEASGRYTVDYRIVSEDGHAVTGEYEYTLRLDKAPSPQDTAQTEAPSTPADSNGSSSAVWILGLGAIGIVLIAALVAVAMRGRRGHSH